MKRVLGVLGILVLVLTASPALPDDRVGAAPSCEYVTLNIQEDQATNASLYVWDDTAGDWARDYTFSPARPIDGPSGGYDHQTSIQVLVERGHHYTVWLSKASSTYYIKRQSALPSQDAWTGAGTTQASGSTPTCGMYNIHFSKKLPSEVALTLPHG